MDREMQEAITRGIALAFNARTRVPEIEHREHHEWVRGQIEKQRAKNQFWTELAAKSLPVIVWTLIAAATASTWAFFKQHWTP